MAKNSTIGRFASSKAKDLALKSALDENGNPTETFEKVIFTALDIQRPLVLKNLQRIHDNHPEDTPEQLAERLGDQYVNTVTGAGAAVGGTAIIPGIGTVAALGLSAVATVGFLEATALYAQSLAELHGLSTEDPDRSKALVMTVMLGDDAKDLLRDASQRSGKPADAASGLNALMGASSGAGLGAMVTEQLKKRFVKRLLVRQGAGFLGRTVPFGIGAVIGGVGNRAMAKAVVGNARTLFGPLPTVIPGEVRGEPVQVKDEDKGLIGTLLSVLPGGKDKDGKDKDRKQA